MRKITISLLDDTYRNVQCQEVVADVCALLRLGQSPTGTGPLSATIAQENSSNLMKLRGLGKHIWKGIDAQEYINIIRQEWDHDVI